MGGWGGGWIEIHQAAVCKIHIAFPTILRVRPGYYYSKWRRLWLDTFRTVIQTVVK